MLPADECSPVAILIIPLHTPPATGAKQVCDGEKEVCKWLICVSQAFRSRFVLVATHTLTHTVVHDGGGVHTIKKKKTVLIL